MTGGFLRGGMRPTSSKRGFPANRGGEKSESPMPSHRDPMASDSENDGGGDDAGGMLSKMHAKHGGYMGIIQHDGMGGPVTTHHVGPDGEVSGPTEHATAEEGAGHLAQMCGGMDSEGSEPDGDEYGAGFAG